MTAAGVPGRAELIAGAESRLAGDGRLLLTGPAGSGKSALVADLADRAEASGRRVLRLSPQPADAALPYATLADLLLAFPADIRDRLPAPQRTAVAEVLRDAVPPAAGPDRLALRLAVGGLLAGTAPVLLTIDGADWADPASAELLATAGSDEVRVLATSRTPGWQGIPTLAVPPLTPEALAEILSAQGLPSRLALRIHAASGGNPGFALAIARALTARGRPSHPLDELPVPAAVQDAVQAQLARIPTAVRTLLLHAALASHPTEPLLRRAGTSWRVGPGAAEREGPGASAGPDGGLGRESPGSEVDFGPGLGSGRESGPEVGPGADVRPGRDAGPGPGPGPRPGPGPGPGGEPGPSPAPGPQP
ncbi:ATP-binding protein, partial [Streptomyces sp. A7024]